VTPGTEGSEPDATHGGAPADLSGLEGVLSGSVRVLRYPHETEPDEDGSTREWHCDVVVADEVPGRGYTTYATVGMRQFDTNVTTGDGRHIRTELVAVGRTGHRAMADVLDACALAVASGSFHVAPGALVPNAVELVDPGHRCRHVLLVPPFLWPELQVVDETGNEHVLTRLQAVPVTTAELTMASEQGHEALFSALDAAGADVTNPDRPSVA